MRETVERFLRRSAHARLIRYLASARAGLDPGWLDDAEREAARELERAKVISSSDGVIALTAEVARILPELRDVVLESGGESVSRGLDAIEELTRALTPNRTAVDLIRAALDALDRVIPFDLAAAVMLEQNLDVYVSRAPGVEDPLTDRFALEVRKVVQSVLHVSLGETDLLVQGNFTDHARAPSGDEIYAHSISAVLEQENRTAGVLIFFRATPFAESDPRTLEIAASQISLVLGSIRIAERIQNLADTDDLTGIWNKRWLRRQLPSEIDRSRIYGVPLSLAMFDIDDFKEINDRWGHAVGDVLLSELCGTIRETLRPPDMFARFGGDEFAVVLPHSDLYGARAVADRILQRTRALRIHAGEDIRCTVSLGLATYVPPSMTAAELIQRADERLYESKRLGKDRVSW